MSAPFTLAFDANGPVATSPSDLNALLIAAVAAQVPGYTAVLPGSLIEDMSSTATGALVIQDQARVDAVNSVSPATANPFVLAQLGQQFGIPQGTPTNGNVLLTFTGTAGYVIPPGFAVSDGGNVYIVQDGAIVQTGGTVSGVFAVSDDSGVFPIPANTVTTVVTSVPSPYTLTVNNPLPGNPAQGEETVESYRARVMNSFQNALSGTPTYIKSLLLAVPGVVERLVSVIPSGSGWGVITSGGDPYAMAFAIYAGVTTPGLLESKTAGGTTHSVSIVDVPNSYTIKYIDPAAQVLTGVTTWNTTLPSFTASATVNQLIAQAQTAYFNGITVGQPINLLVLTEVIQQAIAPVLAPVNLTTLTFAFDINGTPTSPTAGTSVIPSDIESYFTAANGAVTAVQG